MKNTILCAACLATRADVEADAAMFGGLPYVKGTDQTIECCDEESLALYGSAHGKNYLMALAKEAA